MYRCISVPLWHGLVFLDILTDIMLLIWGTIENGLALFGKVPLDGAPWGVGVRADWNWLRFISVVLILWQLYL